ncbi:MAG: histidine phosphatase family protein [Candidatus Micrarchaeota archaeon]|nr:histidine phosphatase family protein [Candidatus Micrarchaeota archaeon]
MIVIFARHGKTEENLKGIVTGTIPGTLSRLGIRQARENAMRLKDKKIDAIYSSRSKRAADTAKIISKYHKGVPLRLTKALMECHFGKLQGTMVGPKLEETFDTDYCRDKFRKQGAESVASYYKRVREFMMMIQKRYPEKTVLLVAHSITFRFFAAVVMGRPVSYTQKIRSLENDELAVFDVRMNKGFSARLIKSRSVLHTPIIKR